MSTQTSATNSVANLSGAAPQSQVKSKSLFQKAMARLSKDRLTLIALGIIGFYTLMALLAPIISEQILNVDYTRPDLRNNYAGVGTVIEDPDFGTRYHILGTDELGRDHLARLLEGGRVSLGVAFGSAFLSLIIGTSLGVISGYYQGTNLRLIDDGLMWFVTTLNSIPALYLLILIASVLKPTVISLILILSIFSVIMVDLASNIGFLILTESSLSFLGLGIREPTPSWGNMLSKAQSFFRAGPHLVIFPGALIVITVLCLYLIGDGLRDAFDPKLSRK